MLKSGSTILTHTGYGAHLLYIKYLKIFKGFRLNIYIYTNIYIYIHLYIYIYIKIIHISAIPHFALLSQPSACNEWEDTLW